MVMGSFPIPLQWGGNRDGDGWRQESRAERQSPPPELILCPLVPVGEGREVEPLCLMGFPGEDVGQGAQQSHLLPSSLCAVKLGRLGEYQ